MNKSQSLFTTLMLGGLLAAGAANGQTNTVPTNYTPPFDAAAAGLKPLFDGKTLNGWVGDPTCWKVVDGAIVGVKGNQNLMTVGDYDDFRIILSSVQVKDPSKTNERQGVEGAGREL